MAAIDVYREAFERLKNGKPVVVQKPYKINLNTVAVEAGKKKGSLRSSRTGFIDLINEINALSDTEVVADSAVKREKRAKENFKKKLQDVQADHDKLASMYMSMLYLNRSMAVKLRENNITPPRFGVADPINVNDLVEVAVDRMAEEASRISKKLNR